MRNSVMPGDTATPSRTPSSATTPPIGAQQREAGLRGARLLALADRASSGIDMARMRSRAAATRSGDTPARLSASSSFCGPSQSGAKMVARAWPLRTRSIGARTAEALDVARDARLHGDVQTLVELHRAHRVERRRRRPRAAPSQCGCRGSAAPSG